MKFFREHKYLALVLLVMLASIVASLFLAQDVSLFDRADLERLLSDAGALAPVLLILVVTVEVIVAPLPGGWLPVVSGAIFGWWGLLYVWIGNVLGSAIAFALARKFGTSLVRRFDRDFNEKHYLEQIQHFWLFYFIPLMPVDVLSFAFGLSTVRFRTFVLVTSIGFAVSMGVLTLFGDSLAEWIF